MVLFGAILVCNFSFKTLNKSTQFAFLFERKTFYTYNVPFLIYIILQRSKILLKWHMLNMSRFRFLWNDYTALIPSLKVQQNIIGAPKIVDLTNIATAILDHSVKVKYLLFILRDRIFVDLNISINLFHCLMDSFLFCSTYGYPSFNYCNS